MENLRKKVVHGIGWRTVADGGQVVLQIIFTAILARLLEIADFGLVAMCFVFLRFVRAFMDVGFGSAIIQSQTITNGQISALFLFQLGLRLVIFAVCVAAAPLAANFFQQPALTELIRVLAFVVILDSFGFPNVMARKELRFQGYSVLSLVTAMLGNVVGIWLALTGFGVWSLIYRVLTEKALYAGAIWFVVGWWPSRPVWRGLGQFVSFGATMFASNFIYFLSQNLASIIIGKFIGAESLGLFNVAYNLAIVPAQKIQSVLMTVFGPAFARLQADTEQLRRATYESLFTISFFFVPAMLGLAAVAPYLVRVLYGEKWGEAGAYLAILAFVGLMKGVEHVLRSLLVARGRPERILKIVAVETVVSIALLSAAAYYFGVTEIVIAYLLGSACAFAMTAYWVQTELNDHTLLRKAVSGSLAVSLVMFAVVMSLHIALDLSPHLGLIALVCTGALVYGMLRPVFMTRTEQAAARRWPVAGWPVVGRLLRLPSR